MFAAGGLASSVFHLGRPERAWRAFSQWRSSWLSREGVLSVATAIPAASSASAGSFSASTGALSACSASLAAALAAGTIFCTGMIYASLKPIHQWRNRWTVPNYFALALMAGFLLLDLLDPLLVLLAGRHPDPDRDRASPSPGSLKETYWRFIDTSSAVSSVMSATGLGRSGRVRMLEPPHTQANYLLQEMGFLIARKHRARLRLVARIAAFALPGLLTLAALFLAGWVGAVLAGLAWRARRSASSSSAGYSSLRRSTRSRCTTAPTLPDLSVT